MNYKCPLCDGLLISFELRTNHEQVTTYRGVVGYLPGRPDADFRCSKGCEIHVEGTNAVEAARERMLRARV